MTHRPGGLPTADAGSSAGPDGAEIVAALERARREGASRDDLLREAIRAIERSADRFDWVGVYLLEDDELVLHDYLGEDTEHDRIRVGVGVCGTAVAEDRDIRVDDVRELDNYLACSAETRSELVVLIREPGTGRVRGQLDLDSDRVAAFSEADRRELARVAVWLGTVLS